MFNAYSVNPDYGKRAAVLTFIVMLVAIYFSEDTTFLDFFAFAILVYVLMIWVLVVIGSIAAKREKKARPDKTLLKSLIP